MSNEQLLYTVCCANLRDQLRHFRVPISSIPANNQERALDALRDGEQDAGDESLAVVFLLEDFDLLTKTGPVLKPESADSFHATLPVPSYRSLELPLNPFDQPSPAYGALSNAFLRTVGNLRSNSTYVPGFWSWNGLKDTVFTSILA